LKNLEIKIAALEVILSVGLIGMLIYFHVQEDKKHKEMIDALNKK
jgi:preprotein translocase subunit Sss1